MITRTVLHKLMQKLTRAPTRERVSLAAQVFPLAFSLFLSPLGREGGSCMQVHTDHWGAESCAREKPGEDSTVSMGGPGGSVWFPNKGLYKCSNCPVPRWAESHFVSAF